MPVAGWNILTANEDSGRVEVQKITGELISDSPGFNKMPEVIGFGHFFYCKADLQTPGF